MNRVEYYARVLLKDSNEWVWVGHIKCDYIPPDYIFLDYFNFYKIFSEHLCRRFMKYEDEILKLGLGARKGWFKGVEKLRRYAIDYLDVFEFKRNPYKLNLGIEEWMLWKKYKGKELYDKI